MSEMGSQSYVVDERYTYAFTGPDNIPDGMPASAYDIYFITWIPKNMTGTGYPD